VEIRGFEFCLLGLMDRANFPDFSCVAFFTQAIAPLKDIRGGGMSSDQSLTGLPSGFEASSIDFLDLIFWLCEVLGMHMCQKNFGIKDATRSD